MNDPKDPLEPKKDPRVGALEIAKALADAETAKAGAAKAEREKAEAESPLAKARKEAEDRQAIDEAQQKAVEAQQKQVTALVPDLGSVKPGSLDVNDAAAVFGQSLAQRATAVAAHEVANVVGRAIPDKTSAQVLITSDPALATSDAIYVEVMSGLDQLSTAAKQLIDRTAPSTVEAAEVEAGEVPAGARGIFGAELAIGSALASALPGVLSLLSAHRTLSTSAVTVDSLAAAAVVAGDLCRHDPGFAGVFHDDFRLLPENGIVQTKVSALAHQRQELVSRKIASEDKKVTESARVAELTAEVKDAEAKLLAAKDAEREQVEMELKRLRDELEDREVLVGGCGARIGLIDSTNSAIDKFTASMQTTAEGAASSPLAGAIMREQLHRSGEDQARFSHVLLVKTEPGSAQQLIDDRPLWWVDTFSTIATSSVTYMLIKTAGGGVIAGGSIGGEAKIHGTIGEDFSIQAETTSLSA